MAVRLVGTGKLIRAGRPTNPEGEGALVLELRDATLSVRTAATRLYDMVPLNGRRLVGEPYRTLLSWSLRRLQGRWTGDEYDYVPDTDSVHAVRMTYESARVLVRTARRAERKYSRRVSGPACADWAMVLTAADTLFRKAWELGQLLEECEAALRLEQ